MSLLPQFDTAIAPDLGQVIQWLARLRSQEGVEAAREAAVMLSRRFAQVDLLCELAQWHEANWWRPLSFGAIRLERRRPEHFEFVWSLVVDQDFSHRLKSIPSDLTPRDLLEILTHDYTSLLPDSRSIQWVVFHGQTPIGLSMFVNINFHNRSVEQIMGILPAYMGSFLVADAYCASLSFAYNSLGMHKVQGVIYESNVQVAQLQERFGFRREGHLRSTVWSDARQAYEDVVQIALLGEEFDRNRVLQRYISRQARDPFFGVRRLWPRQPLKVPRE